MNALISRIRKHKTFFYLFLIILLGFYFRTFNINWDNNYYFHPDERAIIMFAVQLSSPSSLTEFLSPQSPLNPHFFSYGNFPIYLLRGISTLASHLNPLLNEYGGMHIVGRILSAIFDTATIFLVFLIAKRLFSARTGLFAAFFYSISVLPMQLSHFFAVDTILTFLLLSSVLIFIEFLNTPSRLLGTLLGVCIGLALATKVSALILGPAIALSLLFLFLKRRQSKKTIYKTLLYLFLSGIIAVIIFLITQPYVIIDWKEFLKQTSLQTQMSRNPYLFPYTLQYVNKTPYVYELTNIFWWGLGPIISSLSFAGVFLYLTKLRKKGNRSVNLVLFIFAGIYFIAFGSFAVGYMRYMLPLYPFFAITAGYFINEIAMPLIPKKYLASYFSRKLLLFIFVFLCLLYPLSFLSIYTSPNTRIQATDWILKNIPEGSVIATEYWDDSLPLEGFEKYNTIQLSLYEKDTQKKWENIYRILESTDYIILSSHRIYAPLQKLGDCKSVKPGYCYPLTAKYYKNLFDEKLGFKKVAEFTSQPKIPLFPIYINDFSSDENFTVFDHPKVLIFKKIK